MPKIIAAAIQYTPIGSEYPNIVCGKRHCDCFEWMFKHRINYDKKTCVQGFLTNTNHISDNEDNGFLDKETIYKLKERNK